METETNDCSCGGELPRAFGENISSAYIGTTHGCRCLCGSNLLVHIG